MSIRLTSPVEGVTYETTAETLSYLLSNTFPWVSDSEKRLVRDIATLNAALAAEKERAIGLESEVEILTARVEEEARRGDAEVIGRATSEAARVKAEGALREIAAYSPASTVQPVMIARNALGETL